MKGSGGLDELRGIVEQLENGIKNIIEEVDGLDNVSTEWLKGRLGGLLRGASPKGFNKTVVVKTAKEWPRGHYNMDWSNDT